MVVWFLLSLSSQQEQEVMVGSYVSVFPAGKTKG